MNRPRDRNLADSGASRGRRAPEYRRYRDFPDPVVEEGQVLVRVEAVAVENVDRAIVAGTHYTAAQFQAVLPAIPCFDDRPPA